jgi:hypothetical protein
MVKPLVAQLHRHTFRAHRAERSKAEFNIRQRFAPLQAWRLLSKMGMARASGHNVPVVHS